MGGCAAGQDESRRFFFGGECFALVGAVGYFSGNLFALAGAAGAILATIGQADALPHTGGKNLFIGGYIKLASTGLYGDVKLRGEGRAGRHLVVILGSTYCYRVDFAFNPKPSGCIAFAFSP
jgi:hypothetical protein